MGRALRWSYLFLRSWDEAGLKGTFQEARKRFIQKYEREHHEYSRPERVIRDILFVNGCPPEQAPHPYRYRVLHQMEQLRAAGYTVQEIDARSCTPESSQEGNVIVFYRCPFSEPIGEAIRQAKALNKQVVFDIDDLVIDTSYTDTIPQVQCMSREERALYDEGVQRYGATLRMCQAATTTTTRLQRELSKILMPVYINRNCASERMVQLSEAAWRAAKPAKQGKASEDEVILGYFSGSITHNADFEMIQPALLRVMEENPKVKLLLMGLIDLPTELQQYADRVIQKPFVDWEALPEIIAGVDINLAPVVSTVFNEAKSENKWVEAALVKVPTVASRMGPFAELIQEEKTGFLAGAEEWYQVLTRAVQQKELRRQVGEEAYQYCRAHCVTTENTANVRRIYEKLRAPHAAFVLPSCEMSGGIMVALRHACFLQDAGWNVDLIAPTAKWHVWTEFGHSFECISYADGGCDLDAYYDLMVATMWTTVPLIQQYPRVGKRAYLVQNFERDFYPLEDPQRLACEGTYFLDDNWQYLTISRWCEGWLRERYGQDPIYLPNGLESGKYAPHLRDWTGRKVRVLIEGDCAVDYKNVDESFRIVDKLDPERFEIWYMSYNASPKGGYRCDKFLHAVPYEETPKVYGDCDILLKSSWLESFSYPPLEMMATGGYCVVAPNGGNAEYLREGENCLLYPLGEIDAAVQAIERIVSDGELREKLYRQGLETAQARDWKDIQEGIANVYRSLLLKGKE
ncbi:MAG: glycosyltransferase [Clostridia bacterium]|nr:glycosyltransferase [Clostridia bacterium]